MSKYLNQWRRITRFRDRLRDQERDRDAYEDDLWSFFQNCWHLKDWLKSDPAVAALVEKSIEREVAKSEALIICADLANRNRLLHLYRIRKDAKVVGREPAGNERVAMMSEPLGSGRSSPSRSWDYVICLKDGSTRKALSIADEAIRAWEALLLHYGLEL